MPKKVEKMDVMDYPSNSKMRKPNTQDKKVEKVISGKVVRKKKTLGQRFKSIFLSEDIDSVSGYILYDILIPSAKEMLYSVITGGAAASLFGEKTGHRTRREKSTSYVNYGTRYIYDQQTRNRAPQQAKQPVLNRRASHEFDDIILASRGEAEMVLSHLADLTEEYGLASVADFYALVDLPTNYTDQNYGWDDVSEATVSSVRGGWIINLPKVRPLE